VPDGQARSWDEVPEPQNISILLVEDHAATARAVEKYLTLVGYRVHVAADAADARELAAKQSFDLVLCDINLPDGNGWDLMRELNRARPIPGIAISGFASADDIRRSERAGFARHLAKPFSPEDLMTAVESLSVASS
jgi:CheY-like chemotaxis protein